MMKLFVRPGWLFFRCMGPAFRCNLFCPTRNCTAAKKYFRYNQAYEDAFPFFRVIGPLQVFILASSNHLEVIRLEHETPLQGLSQRTLEDVECHSGLDPETAALSLDGFRGGANHFFCPKVLIKR
jgi:hypothetical protein